ncbi:MAG: magnesium transporter [Hyphomicrobiaceae bacterium]
MSVPAAEADDHPWDLLRDALDQGDIEVARGIVDELGASEGARAVLHLEQAEQVALMELIGAEAAALIVEQLPDASAAALIEALDADDAAEILDELDGDDQADLLTELDDSDADAILAEMAPEDRANVSRLMSYDQDTAGGLMTPEVFQFEETQTVSSILQSIASGDDDFERYRGQHPYIIAADGTLVGVVSLRGLLTSRRSEFLSAIMSPVASVGTSTPITELSDLFEDHPYLGIPVTNDFGILIGVVSRGAVSEAELERAEADVQKLQGLVKEELRSMPTGLRARRRLAWLTINIGLNIIAASVIAFYEDTLAAVIALAVFLPIVSDMSGCSGNQAVAVSLRELSLGVTRPQEIWRVWSKEISVGVINGIALGILIAVAAWLWKGNPYIGLVVGLALALNTMVAVSIGGVVPLVLKQFDVDPAIAAGPMLTTITDMCGFFLVLSLATMMMPLLV